jgi:hypothetical protein
VGGPDLPLPEEPVELKNRTRTLLEQSPEAGRQVLAEGEWIAAPLWDLWRDQLELHGLDRARFVKIVVGYQNELRLWVMGERPWEHCVAGLAGRVVRRITVEENAEGQ